MKQQGFLQECFAWSEMFLGWSSLPYTFFATENAERTEYHSQYSYSATSVFSVAHTIYIYSLSVDRIIFRLSAP
jgi:hypothetical protein